MPHDTIYNNKQGELFINGRLIQNDNKYADALAWLDSSFYGVSTCPYCKFSIVRAFHEDDPPNDWPHVGESAFVVECQNCGFWQSYWEGKQDFPGECEWEGQMSKLSEFPENIPDECIDELAQYLKAHPSYWHIIKPGKLEKLVADIFRANYSNSEVIHVGQPYDGGVDVLFIDSGNQKWLIQVKRRESAIASEGVSTLRNLLGVLLLNNAKYGMVVSTADHFTYWANQIKEKAAALGYIIELIDLGKLKRLINPLIPNRQWMGLIERRKPDWIKAFVKEVPDRNQLTIEDYIKHLSSDHK